ncbi:MAG TPA: MupA/Atu3671 family FMN-dependent luciferase-like monooxygenase [Candidatus Polarisedimenticolia bacterium]|nr:MupA/Atu3671 family FMN-dependent luciferase-like monooxygenase [Candidatus Polarisedimenticolia bacterium]
MTDLDRRITQLSPERRRLLEQRLRQRGLDKGPAGSGPARSGGAGGGDRDPEAWRGRPVTRPIRFSLYFFSDDGSRTSGAKYRLALESARFADQHGFAAVWTPERHFQPFGGLYPNPAVLGAALAAVTTRVGIRAGSVALPLHNPVRVAEEWAVVDNLSGGRAAVSFASGWHPDDFVLFPTPYDDRKEAMFRGIETIRELWAGRGVTLDGPGGRPVEVRTLPRPIQKELPIWVTSAGNPDTWKRAGSIGANVLAALVGYSPEDLAARVLDYRRARSAAGHDPASGMVTLVAHTFVGGDDASVRALVREPMVSYLQGYLKQFQKGGAPASEEAEQDARDVAELAFDHHYDSSTLLGTQAKCARVLDALAACGADEAACLIDFGLDPDRVLSALPLLAELKSHYEPSDESKQHDDPARGAPAAMGAAPRVESHG